MVQQPERSPCQQEGGLLDVPGMDRGGAGGRRLWEVLWLQTGQGSCQSPKRFIIHASKRMLGTCSPWRLLCWPQREEAECMCVCVCVCEGGSVVAGTEERALSWGSGLLGSGPPLPPNSCSVVSVTEQGGWVSHCLRPKVYPPHWSRQPGGGPSLVVYSSPWPGAGG